MSSLSIYPQDWDGEDLTVNREVLVAVVYPGSGQGHIEVLVPSYETPLRELFERPVILPDRYYFAWSPDAIQYALDSGLAPLGLFGESDR